MSKFEKVKEQYPLVTNATLLKLYNEDRTSSKKYFPYMVKMWDGKKMMGESFSSATLVQRVIQFDELLPYIKNKDIYSEAYSTFSKLTEAITAAEIIKEEKTFNRDEHILVLEETDEYIFLSPLTHRGSLKYGANTRWCTASKHDEYTFNRYNKTGFLAYLIPKNSDKESSSKIAFWSEDVNSPFSGEVMIFNSADSLINDSNVIGQKWEIETLFKLMMKFRHHAYTKFKLQKAESNLKKKLNVLRNFDFQQLQQDIGVINTYGRRANNNSIWNDEAEQIIKMFLDGINKQLEENG